ncbi:MAG TPA: signal recognition particle receptor subunit alpha, partial [Chitinophagales bacterium]|nr:signal recognition particle receptor subunit alpha [Chitinophagales bacterium]
MFENLQEKLESAFKTLKGQGQITELNVAATMKEIRRALVDADVNYKIAKEFTDKVRDEALGQKVLIAVQPGQLLVKIMSDELTKLMGSTVSDITISGNPAVILISGLQGSGKTTFSSKLAWYLKNNRKKDSLLIAGDVYRPAAIEQLKIMGQKVNTEVYSEPENKNPVQIALNGIEYAKQKNIPVVIIDTAGRLAIDEQMMNEIAAVKQATNPCETLFVVDSMTGQDAVNTAKAFNDRLNFDGIVLTKLDGTRVDVESQNGKIVVLAIGASWLPLSDKQAEFTNALAKRYAAKNVVFYFVVTDSTNPRSKNFASNETVAKFAADRKLTMTVLRDSDGVLTTKNFKIEQVPSFVIL